MSRNSEIKNREILENKPYLTKRELSYLLEKTGKNLDKKISQLVRNQYLLYLKKGLYAARTYYLVNKTLFPEFLANFLYSPSYLSLEYVLQSENLIPETVYQYTSISLKPTRKFKNQIAVFNYQNIKKPLFTGYICKTFLENYQIKIANKAKALFDFLYLRPFSTTKFYEQIYDLRLNWGNFNSYDMRQFEDYTLLSKSKKMFKILTVIKKKFYADK